MPQLSPMMGFIISIVVLSFFFVFICGLSKPPAKVTASKLESPSNASLNIFKLWNGSTMPKL